MNKQSTVRPYPEVRFINARLLINALEYDLRPRYRERGFEEVLDPAYSDKKVEEYTKLWKPQEKLLLTSLCDLFDLTYEQNIIDIYVAPLRRSFSDPMVIKTALDHQDVLGVIVHEMTHRLLCANTRFSYNRHLLPKLKMVYPGYTDMTLEHIPVLAAYKILVGGILDDEACVQRDMSYERDSDDYRIAWEHVHAHGAQVVIGEVKQLYAEI